MVVRYPKNRMTFILLPLLVSPVVIRKHETLAVTLRYLSNEGKSSFPEYFFVKFVVSHNAPIIIRKISYWITVVVRLVSLSFGTNCFISQTYIQFIPDQPSFFEKSFTKPRTSIFAIFKTFCHSVQYYHLLHISYKNEINEIPNNLLKLYIEQ